MISMQPMAALVLACAASLAFSGEDNPVDAGLKWLALHQEEDGHWDSGKYNAETKNDAIVTSLSLMAFLGAGHSEKVGEHKNVVKKAVAWLRQQQDPDGRIFDRTDAIRSGDEGAAVSFAVLALTECAAMARVAETRQAAAKAVDYCSNIYPMEKSNGAFAFNKHVDTVVAGWCIFALKSAKVAGSKVDNAAFAAAIKYLNSVEHKGEDGVLTYWFTPTEETSPQHSPARIAAAALVGKQFIGAKKDELQPSVNYLIKTSGFPVWDEEAEKVDMCYWWMGTLCLFQQGGDLWKQWSAALQSTLIEKQLKEGDFTGSWALGGKAGKDWGRVGQTALAVMALEVYYRAPGAP